MNKNLFLAGAILASAFPSVAWAGNPYVRVEAGVGKVRGNDVDQTADFSSTQTPATLVASASAPDAFFDDVFGSDYGRERDLNLAGGYDFGWFQTELELGHKRTAVKRILTDDLAADFLNSVNTALNRPSAAPDPGAPGLAPLTVADFQTGGSVRILNLMANVLFDIPVGPVTLSAGGGLGRSFGRALGDRDQAMWAGQYMVGARVPVSKAVDLGLNYRYFNSGILKFDNRGFDFAGNPDRLTLPAAGGGTTTVDRTTSARIVSDIEGEYRSRALLVSLTYNFGR
jgi:opacity protein-like surface antigen